MARLQKASTGRPGEKTTEDFLAGKSDHSILLFHYFIAEFGKVGKITLLLPKR